MNVPKQIQEQTEAIHKLYEELNGDSSEESQEQENGYEAQDHSGDAESSSVKADQEDPFEQKYKTLQGMYNVDVNKYRAQNRELEVRVRQLEELLSSMTANPAPTETEKPEEQVFSEQDLEDYGDYVDIARKVVRNEMTAKDAEIADLRNTVRQLQGTVVPQVHKLSQEHTTSNTQRFWADLQTAVPDYREVNENRDFQSWLLDIDPLTGYQRQVYLDDAQRNFDAQRVATIFQTWKRLHGGQATPTEQNKAASELERQVAPGKSRAGGPKTQGDTNTFTPEDIKNFYRDVQKGKYNGKEDERDKIERSIFRAQREGRVVT